jgi:NitT/TauT family transport system substrate-binding protein
MNFYTRILNLLPIIFLFVSCQPEQKNTITIGILDGPTAVSFIQMMEKPPVIQGKQVEFVIKNEPLQIQALMMQNKLDFAVLPTVMAVNLYNKGIDFRLLAIPIWGTLYLVSNDPVIQKLEQISDQKIYVFGQGATADVLMQHFLKSYLIKDVQLDYSYNTNMELATAMLRKKISLAVISEPLVSMLQHQQPDIHIITHLDIEWTNNKDYNTIFAQTSFLAKSNMTEHYPDIIHGVCQAYNLSCALTYQQPESTAELLVEHGFYPSTDLAVQTILLCNIQFKYAHTIKEEIRQYLSIFYNFDPKSIGGKMPDDNFIFDISKAITQPSSDSSNP